MSRLALVPAHLNPIRDELERLLGFSLPAVLWGKVAKRPELQRGPAPGAPVDLSGVLEQTRELAEVRGIPHLAPSVYSRCDKDGDDAEVHHWAVSEYIARVAATTSDHYRDFEMKELGTLRLDQVEGWLTQLAVADSPEDDQSGTSVLLPYLGSEGESKLIWAEVQKKGLVDQIARHVRQLARWFHWREAEAMMFVLVEGFVPCVQTAEVLVRFNYDRPLLSRIQLTIDPMMGPAEVADLYRQYRTALMPGRRNRPMEAKSMRLAIHGMDRMIAVDDDDVVDAGKPRSWAELMQSWNDEVDDRHPDWVYDDEVRFGNDSRDSLKRLINVPFDL